MIKESKMKSKLNKAQILALIEAQEKQAWTTLELMRGSEYEAIYRAAWAQIGMLKGKVEQANG